VERALRDRHRRAALPARPADEWPTLEEILRMSEREHEEAFEGTALERPGRAGLARSAAVVLENARRGRSAPAA